MFKRFLTTTIAGLSLTVPAAASDTACIYGSYATLEEAQTASDALFFLTRVSTPAPELCADLDALGVPEACPPPPPPPTVTSLCRGPQDPDPEARKTVFFNAVIDEVVVTSGGEAPSGTQPTAPSVGGIVSGSVTYFDAYNYLAEDLSTEPDFAGLSLSEIDAVLPGGIFTAPSITLNTGSLQSELKFSGNRDATWPTSTGLVGLSSFAPVTLGNNFSGAGDLFVTAGISPIGPRSGFGTESVRAFNEAVNWYSTVRTALFTAGLTVCGEGLTDEELAARVPSADLDVSDILSNYVRYLQTSRAQGVAIQVADADSAALIPGIEREIGQSIYPTLSGATQNTFDWSFTQFGTPAPVAPLDLSPIQGLGSGSFGSETCNNGLETISAWYAGLEQPTFAPSQRVNLRGRITSLSPTLALDPLPPTTAVPLPAGLPLGLAGLGALVWLRQRRQRAD